ncbi:MAG: endolytic transglycosylase MltG [Ruminococcaceae bacterium]|nr:endolytic transglycosylase MltG [Oscillospiraceae bacterium]
MSDFKSSIDPKDFTLSIPEEELDAIVNIEDEKVESKIPALEKPEVNDDFYSRDIEEKAQRKEHKRRNKIKSAKNKGIFRIVWVVMVVLVGITLASYLIEGANDFFAVGRGEGQATVIIPEDVTAEELAEILYINDAIEKKEFFNIFCTVTADMEYFEPGTYVLDKNMDYQGIISYLQGGQENLEVVTVTFQEGMTVLEVAEKLEKNGVASKEEILEACKSQDFNNYDMIERIENDDDRYYLLEGYLFPDTYDFYLNENVDSVLGKMLYNFQIRITSDVYEKIENSGYTLEEIITLASIIQAEAANKADMYMISAILHNRLENGASMDIYTLGCDCTVFYPYQEKSDAPNGFNSDYNTYDIEGLPAGPVCSPGLDAIKAAVSPSDEGAGYYYFCHDSDGNPYYARTASEHQANLVAAGLAE